MSETKQCSGACKSVKPLTDFWRNKRAPSGIEYECKACLMAKNRAGDARRRADPVWRERKNKQRMERYRAQMATPEGAAEKQRKQAAYAAKRADLGGTYKALTRFYRHGITDVQFQQMLADQGGKCAGCTDALDLTTVRKTHVDHCPTTGAVRGLLCNLCNSALGHARDNTDTLARLIAYLEKSRGLR